MSRRETPSEAASWGDLLPPSLSSAGVPTPPELLLWSVIAAVVVGRAETSPHLRISAKWSLSWGNSCGDRKFWSDSISANGFHLRRSCGDAEIAEMGYLPSPQSFSLVGALLRRCGDVSASFPVQMGSTVLGCVAHGHKRRITLALWVPVASRHGGTRRVNSHHGASPMTPRPASDTS